MGLVYIFVDKTSLKPNTIHKVKLIIDNQYELSNPVVLTIRIKKEGGTPVRINDFDNFGLEFNKQYSVKTILSSETNSDKFKLLNCNGYDKINVFPQVINKDDEFIFSVLADEKDSKIISNNSAIQNVSASGKIAGLKIKIDNFSTEKNNLRLSLFLSFCGLSLILAGLLLLERSVKAHNTSCNSEKFTNIVADASDKSLLSCYK